ncbi:ArsR family transcriptional regulator [Methanococcoides methylutens]|uniref:ArsR family transcriptional regulator n=1 Tax=Methanococcoides methylutens TaxID=2226 RepID=UPI00404414FC
MARQIILINIEKPVEKDVEKDIHWFCDSFGLSSGRDVENISKKIVMELLSSLSRNEEVTSEMLARSLGINLSRVNHHLRNLIGSGLVYRRKKMLYLRGGSLKAAVCEMRKDSERIFDELDKIAEDIDNEFGLRSR